MSAPLDLQDEESTGSRLVRIVTLNRPEHRNPLDHTTVCALLAAIEGAVESPEIGAFVLTGRGEAFSAGGDLRGYLKLYDEPEAFWQYLKDFRRLCNLLECGPLVTVAMINGACVAGGLELALACDLSYISDGARIGDGHVRSGQLPGAGGSQRLCRTIGLMAARELLLTGELLDAHEAARIGLVTKVFAAEKLHEECLKSVGTILQNSALGIARMKELIAFSQRSHLAEGLAEEMDVVHDYATTSHDAREGLESFLEQRPPSYRDLGR